MNLKATGVLVLAALIVGIIAWSNVFAIAATRIDEGSLDDYTIVQSRPGTLQPLGEQSRKVALVLSGCRG